MKKISLAKMKHDAVIFSMIEVGQTNTRRSGVRMSTCTGRQDARGDPRHPSIPAQSKQCAIDNDTSISLSQMRYFERLLTYRWEIVLTLFRTLSPRLILNIRREYYVEKCPKDQYLHFLGSPIGRRCRLLRQRLERTAFYSR